MRTIVHVSDVHFGSADPLLVAPLVSEIQRINPALVVISGDLTQRARISQFQQAREFLEQLPGTVLTIPGNHDIPLNVYERFFQPLTKYRRFISEDLEPTYLDDEVAVFSINTARSFTTDRGSISDVQLDRAHAFFDSAGDGRLRIVVTHHPFDLPASVPDSYRVRGAERAMEVFAECQVDLFLAGHAHLSFATSSATRYHFANHSALIVQAGTAISTRRRGEANSFNVIEVTPDSIAVQPFFWDPNKLQFLAGKLSNFQGRDQGWRAA